MILSTLKLVIDEYEVILVNKIDYHTQIFLK